MYLSSRVKSLRIRSIKVLEDFYCVYFENPINFSRVYSDYSKYFRDYVVLLSGQP